MSRRLRPRKPQNYATLLEGDLEDDSSPNVAFSENGSSEEFHPEAANTQQVEKGVGNEVLINEENADTQAVFTENDEVKKGKKRKRSPQTRGYTINLAPGLSRPIIRQNYILPTPSIDHRHRPKPLYRHQNPVERLLERPSPFREPKTKLTRNWTHDASVTDRLTRASGFNVGNGPVWDLMEDRSWWKESLHNDVHGDESHRRPRVYDFVKVPSGWSILDNLASEPYIPSSDHSSSMQCHFGVQNNSKLKKMQIFDSADISSLSPKTQAIAFYAGAGVSAIDWCPIFCDDLSSRDYMQYLAVAPLPEHSYSPLVGVRKRVKACIQIWALSPKSTDDQASNNGDNVHGEDIGQLHCDMVLCIENGPALDMKWCPLPSNDPWNSKVDGSFRKLGILAGAFEDGTLSIYVVPDPLDLKTLSSNDRAFVHIPSPALYISLEHTSCCTLDWANSEILAVGCTDGSIAVYKIKEAFLDGNNKEILPTYFVTVHQSAISAIHWIRAPPVSARGDPDLKKDPAMIVSGGFDGCEVLTDLREGASNIMNRTRGILNQVSSYVINTISYSTYVVGAVSTDNDNEVKVYSMCPDTLGRGHVLLDSGSPIWSVHASDYHAQLAVGCADGTCMTTNVLKSTRRSTSVPFLTHKIYQLDYNRNSGEYRMIDNFLPQIFNEKALSQSKKKHKNAPKSETASNIGNNSAIWPSQVGVLRVVWNTGGGLSHAPLLASSTASGLCRVDWLLGRVFQDKQPYGGVDKVRGEVSVGDVVESDDSE